MPVGSLRAKAAGALLGAAVLAGFAPDAEARRVALVIGNADFVRAPDLANPANDAMDVANRLAELGFELAGGGPQLNLSRAQMVSAFAGFAEGLESGDLAVVFFAGHGAQYRGENYLIPVDDKGLDTADELPDAAYSAGALLQLLAAAKNVTSVVLLDACRNNPLPQAGAKTTPVPGLAEIAADDASYSLVMFATAIGSTASDGLGRNSPFTAALLRALDRPERSLTEIIHEVRRMVRQATGGAQVPWSSSSLEQDIWLVQRAAPQPPAVARDSAWQDEAFALYEALTLADPQARLAALRAVRDAYPAGAAAATLAELIADLERDIARRES